jgi:hypothetical protein
MEDAPIRVTNVKARIGGVIYWLFAATALLLIATSAPNNRLGLDIGQVLAGGVVYAIGRDMRRVVRGSSE